MRRVLVLVVALSLLAPISEASAQCTTRREASAIEMGIRRRTACNYRKLRSGPAVRCRKPRPAPACAASLVDDAVALVYGPNNPATAGVDRRALRRQLACQKQIGKAVGRFVGTKLRLLARGKSRAEAEARARGHLDRLLKRCPVPVVQPAGGNGVPAVGAPCQGTLGGPGRNLDADALRACLLTALEIAVDRVAPNPPARPNLVVILTDDQRWDTTGLVHSLDGVTPVMPNVETRLAATGITFPNAFVTTALCCPSRSSLLKGEYAHTTGVLTNQQPLGGARNFDDGSSLATWLQSAGYRTGLYGKYLNGYATLWDLPEPPYVPPGWDEWHAFRGTNYYDYGLVENGADHDHALVRYQSGCTNYTGCPADQAGEDPCPAPQNYSTDVLLAKALDFLDRSAGQPFFLYFAPFAPHGPACPAKQDEGSFAGLLPWRPPNFNEADDSDKPAWVQLRCPLQPNAQTNNDNFRRRQLESLQAVDRAVGAILDKLAALGQDENTLVLFTSDNGYAWGAHCHRPKRCPYEECMRVPLVVRYPALGMPPRAELRVGLNIDFAFTFAELAGVVPPLRQDGRSLANLLAEREPAWRTDFLYEQWLDPDDEEGETNLPPTLAAVRGAQWKWVEYVSGERELYDLLADPFELENRANDAGLDSVKTDMAARLRQLRPDWSPSGAFLDP